MDISLSFNPAKSERNRRERNLPFERAYDFDFETAEFFPTSILTFPNGASSPSDISMIDCIFWFLPNWRIVIMSSASEKRMSTKQRKLASRKSVTDEDGEVADLTVLSRKDFRPFSSLPKSIQTIVRGRLNAEIKKQPITIRLSPDVVAAFRATGAGWQTRMDAALKDWLRKHKPNQP